MLLLDVTIVDGKLVCWGRRPDRQLPPNGHTRSAPGRPRDRPVRGPQAFDSTAMERLEES
jgi:hypothetical protein